MLRLHQPDMLLANLLAESYHTLLTHCDRVFGKAFQNSTAFPKTVASSSGFSLRSIFPRIPQPTKEKVKLSSPAWAQQERKFKLIRWAFFGTAGLLFGTYGYAIGIVPMYLQAMRTVRSQGEPDDEDDDEDEEDDDEN